MKLTNRRKQFLEVIVHMYSETNEPIHYSEIAKSIGVSKWTAYDVLKELEKQDFLERSYTVNQHETGRSIILYTPTEKSKILFEKNRHSLSNEEEWQQIKNEVIGFVNKAGEAEKPIGPLFNTLAKAELKVELCAYFIGVLLVYLNREGKRIQELTINLINVSNTPVIKLTAFVGAVIGMIIESASEEISPEMVQLVKQFTATLEELNRQEMLYLLDLIKEAPNNSGIGEG
ncbi:transscriptional regulator [Bacillus sp. M6-12]|uniref:transscriptional regulator n=1 Tax=Bacillus sp. M6-12 TaxID=2054166 RepID=UPI000C7648C4|nr:transscriptional regulator [Bacillus sp. M6-12]PLS17395.1 transscriptional regulator [Bacillus sp. M6-12]